MIFDIRLDDTKRTTNPLGSGNQTFEPRLPAVDICVENEHLSKCSSTAAGSNSPSKVMFNDSQSLTNRGTSRSRAHPLPKECQLRRFESRGTLTFLPPF
jgi:hypothetical protein